VGNVAVVPADAAVEALLESSVGQTVTVVIAGGVVVSVTPA
jgi:hypothetical protein